MRVLIFLLLPLIAACATVPPAHDPCLELKPPRIVYCFAAGQRLSAVPVTKACWRDDPPRWQLTDIEGKSLTLVGAECVTVVNE